MKSFELGKLSKDEKETIIKKKEQYEHILTYNRLKNKPKDEKDAIYVVLPHYTQFVEFIVDMLDKFRGQTILRGQQRDNIIHFALLFGRKSLHKRLKIAAVSDNLSHLMVSFGCKVTKSCNIVQLFEI